MRIWPKIKNYLFSESKFWFQFHVYRARNWSWLLMKVQFLCFSESILLVVMIRHFLEECIHDKPLYGIVWNHQCPWSWNIVPLQQHVQILLPYRIYSVCFLVKAIWSVLISLQQKILVWWDVILQRNCCLDFTEINWLTHQNLRLPRSILMGFKLFTHVCNCSAKTELIGKNNYSKYSFNCWIICSEMYRQFSMSFALEYTPGQWSRCTENRTSAFCEFRQHFVRDMIPSSLCTDLFSRIPLLFRTWTNEWPLPNTKSLCKYLDRLWHFPKNSSLQPLPSQQRSLNIDI